MADSILNLTRTQDRLMIKPNWVQPIESTFDFYREIYGYSGTVTNIFNLSKNYSHQVTYTFTNLNSEDEFNLTHFFCLHRGRCRRFWVPLWYNAFKLNIAVSAGDNILTIINNNFYRVDRGYDRIFLLLKNGDLITRSVTLVLKGLNNTENILLDSPIDRDIGLTDYTFFGKFLLSRFMDDKMDLKYNSDTGSSCQLSIKELPFEYIEEEES